MTDEPVAECSFSGADAYSHCFLCGESGSACRERGRSGNTKDYTTLTDGELKTYLPFRESKGMLEITAPSPAYGVYIMLFDKFGRPLSYDLQTEENGEWVTAAQGGEYLVHWHPLETPARRLRIVTTSKERLRVAELRVYGPGEKPGEVQAWSRLEKCDLMLLTAHPDDEILWFAGLLPTGGQRKLELLSAIWHCGVHYYPELLNFIDKNGKEAAKQYELWRGKNRVLGRVVECVRKHQPEVLVTHGEGGEYGHGAHKTAADAAKQAYTLAAKKNSFPQSVKEYGVWQIKKLYLHEYAKNQILCDWDEPLAAFGGKTGFEVAEEAFQFHGSQIRRNWEFERHGKHDNAQFGLYATAVGQDSGIGDLMEHITDTENE